ncbi:2-keto-4-pentenoate hydratase [Pacificimonas sp. ICDLI1SI03]
MSASPILNLAKRLSDARKAAEPLALQEVEAVVASLKDGYETADALAELEGRRRRVATGWKIGLTSAPALAAFGAKEPMVGRLYADALLSAHAPFSLSQAIAPRLEGEIMIEIGAPCAADAPEEELLASIAAVYPAYEIADSRIGDWPRDVKHAVADNACCGWYLMPEKGLRPQEIDLAAADMGMKYDGDLVSEGCSSDCLGGPLSIYRWFLANSELTGRQLSTGDLILTGALGPAVPMRPNCRCELQIEGFEPLILETSE